MGTGSLVQKSSSAQREEDRVLVHRCRSGDKEAFARLMRRHERQIYNFTYRMLGSEEEAEDLTQDIFVAAYRGIKGFRGEAKFSTWLYRIALNQARNRIKYLSRRNFFAKQKSRAGPAWKISSENLEALPDSAPTPEQWTMTRDLAAQVQQCLNQLPHAARQILILRDVQGFSYEELSQMLSLNLGTVKSRLHRARIALQECLTNRLE
ncbi:MAG: sigma-70 family RNA polymerase sigma factor [Deltaproteobacteria bacterium]|nr:MAG: sigma-70 family RNA polymerase sigma factor [Deltaproteobacteria bacterium]